jgi:hypothetical protein
MNDNMEWHVITSSKGGIGKTLLTLLLLAYYLEKKQDGSVLMLDLNGMNTDSTSILLYRKYIGKPVAKSLQMDIKSQMGGEQIIFQKTYSITEQGQQRYYIQACPFNPFVLYNPNLFADLLTSIKRLIPEIQKELQLPQPLKYVFIDTNYHFCNLFSQDDSHYKVYQKGGKLGDENIKVWFLWVYRQLEKLVREKESNEAILVRSTANMIEKHLGKQEQIDCETPFKHVFSPAALVTSRSSKKELPTFLKGLYDAIFNQHDFVIPEFDALENKGKGRNICFEPWVEQLQVAYSTLTNNITEEQALLFLPVLIEAIKKLTPKQRPENIMPISVYHPSLQQYTDKDRGDIIATVRGMKIYKHFSKLL